MTLEQVQQQALELISSVGDTDYTQRSRALINHAQLEIAEIEKIKGIKVIIQTGEDIEEYNTYTLSNFKELRYIKFGDNYFADFRLEGNKLTIPKIYDGDFTIFFYKYPTEINSTTDPKYEFEISLRGQQAIPYYVASMLIMEENKDFSGSLYSIYINKLKTLYPIADNNFSQVINVTGW